MALNVDLDQFKGLDINDAGAWPIPVKMVAILIVCAAVLGAGYWFHVQHQIAELEEARKKEQSLKETFKARQLKAASLEDYRKQMAEMERSFGAMLKQLPSETEVAELLTDISKAGLANGLEFELFKPKGEVPAEFYAELPIDIKVTGNYHDFGRFISDVAQLSRIVTLHDIVIKGADKDSMTLTSVAKTYRYLEEEQ